MYPVVSICLPIRIPSPACSWRSVHVDAVGNQRGLIDRGIRAVVQRGLALQRAKHAARLQRAIVTACRNQQGTAGRQSRWKSGSGSAIQLYGSSCCGRTRPVFSENAVAVRPPIEVTVDAQPRACGRHNEVFKRARAHLGDVKQGEEESLVANDRTTVTGGQLMRISPVASCGQTLVSLLRRCNEFGS